jgi:hypothetical protein
MNLAASHTAIQLRDVHHEGLLVAPGVFRAFPGKCSDAGVRMIGIDTLPVASSPGILLVRITDGAINVAVASKISRSDCFNQEANKSPIRRRGKGVFARGYAYHPQWIESLKRNRRARSHSGSSPRGCRRIIARPVVPESHFCSASRKSGSLLRLDRTPEVPIRARPLVCQLDRLG